MSTHYEMEFGIETLGKPKGFAFCISIGDLDVEEDFSFPCKFLRVIVRRTTSFCNKELQFFLLEKVWWTVSNALLWIS